MTAIDASKLDGLTLAKGGHESPDEGLMEALAYVRGIEHADHPPCVAPLLAAMGRSLHGVLPDDLRQQLVPLIPDLPGTVDDGHDEKRSYMALDWLIRTWLPAWLDLSPACREDAARVRELGRIVDLGSAQSAGPVVRQATAAASAAATDAATDAAWDAARAAAWAAAWDAAWAAAAAAAWDAAEAALAPTVTALQESAIDLYARMIQIGAGR